MKSRSLVIILMFVAVLIFVPTSSAFAQSAPAKITDLKAVVDDKTVTLTWTAPDLNGGIFYYYKILYYDSSIDAILDHSDTSITLTFSNVVPQTFAIRTVTSAVASSQSDVVTATPIAPQPPSRITDLAATVGDGKVELTWTAPNLNGGTFKKYDIFYRHDNLIVSVRILDHSTTSKIITGLINGENYTFTVRTSTSAGISLQSNAVTVTQGLSSRITDLAATVGDGKVELTWTAPNLNGGTFKKYDIFYRHDNLIVSVRILDHSTTSKTITGLTNDENYTFTVKTVASEGSSLASNAVTVTPIAPQPPSRITDLAATVGDGKVELTWTAPNLNGGIFENYEISDGGVSENIGILDHSTTSKIITGLINGENYTFTVRTSTSAGISLQSNEVTVTPGLSSRITDLAATVGDGKVELTWTAPNLNGGIFENYEISDGGVSENIGILDHSTTSKIITGLINGENYTFTVRTQNSAGISLQSNEVTVTPGLSSRITDLAATVGDGKVELTWTAPNLNGGIFENYEISDGGVSENIGILDHSTTSKIITGLINGENYTFTVRTQNSAGISLQSNEVTVTPGLSSRITDLAATVGDGGEITLTWTAPNLNGGEFVSYDIFYYDIFYYDISEAASDYSTTSKTFTDLSISRNHVFRVITVTSEGSSLASNVVTVTPTAPVTPLATQPPSSITDLKSVVVDGRKVILTWTAPNLNGGTFDYYEVFHNGRNLPARILDHSGTKISYNGSVGSSSHTVVTHTSAGISLPSNVVTNIITGSLPSQITDLAATAGDGTVTLTWTAPDLNHGIFVSYDIFYGDGNTIETIRDYSTTSETITGLSNDAQYVFTIRTTNSAGLSSQSNAVSATPLAPQPPSQITDLRAVAGVESVILTWTAPNLNGGEFVSYDIYTRGSDIIETISDHSTTSKTITGLSNDVRYDFVIRTVTSDGTSLSSNIVTATPTSPVTPSPITDLAATAGDGKVELTWTAPELNGGTFENYTITYGGETVKITSHSTTSTAIPDLNNGEEYTFTITATTDLGTSTPSDGITATPAGLPSPITDLAATAGDGKVELTWTAPELNGGTFENYTITYGGETVKITSHSTTSTAIPDLNNGEEYTFTITATTDLGTSTPSDGITATPAGLPSPITDLAATAGDGKVELTWTAPELNGGTFENYTITYGGETVKITSHSTTSTAIPDLNNGEEYTFTITATTDLGTSTPSDGITATPAGLPSPITDLAATAGDGKVELTWTAPELNGGTFENYTITYGGETVKITSHSTTSTAIPDLNNGEEYTFTITATTDLGTSTPSDGITATPAGLPSPITDLAATAGDGKVELTWTAPELNGGTFENYTITYGGETVKITSHSTTSTAIPDLNNGEEYTFTITATTDLGTSTPSDGITATPAGLPSPITDLAATAGDGKVELTWTAPELNGGTFENYTITYGGETVKITSHSTTSTAIPDLNNGEEYTFTITATTDLGTSTPSDGITATPAGLPSPITDLAATAGDGKVELTWTAPELNGGTFENYTITYGGETVKITSHSTTSTAIPDLNNGEEYTFTITATTDLGTSTPSDGITATPAGLPSPITDLAATAGDGKVELTWTAPELNGGTFENYTITYGGETVKITSHSTTSTAIPDLNNGEEYTFTITATTDLGTSTPSDGITATPAGLPSPITDLAATAGDGKVELTWNAPELNGGTFENYTITYGGETVKITSHSTTSTAIPDLNNGEEYTFTITATTDLGTSTPSDGITATPAGLPSPITDLAATAGDGKVELTWTAPELNGGTFENYTITYGGETVKITSHSTTSTAIPDLNNGEEYTFTITATTDLGTSTPSDGITATPAGLPSPITDLAATAGDGKVELTWNAPELNGGTFENYTITYGGETVKITSHSTTSTAIPDLNNGEEYTFTITATTDLGTSTPSDGITATPAGLPSPITDLAATAGDGKVELTWNAPELNGGTFENYTITYGGETVKITSHSTTSTAIPDLNNGEEYTFTITATTDLGTSTPSDGITATPAGLPSPITDLAATAGDGKVELTWTAPELNGGTFENYTITYGGETVKITSHSTTSTAIPDLNNGEEYTFTITATTDLGTSTPSDGITATPAGLPSPITDLAATAGDGKVELTWTAPELNGGTFENYTITYGGETVKITSHSTTSTAIPDLNNGEEYTFTITATTDLGTSTPSDGITATPAGLPSPITDLAATAGDGKVELTWNAPELNGGTFENYTITYGGETVKITSHSTTSTAIPDLNNGEEYTFTITATTDLGTSTPSDGITATPAGLPSPITDLAATAGDGKVELTWTAPELNGGTFENYTITYGGETVKITSHSTTSTAIPDLNNGEEYTFTITATTDLGTSTPSDGITATPAGLPSPITDLAATAGDGKVELTWNAPELNGGTFENYTITYGGETVKITSHSTTSTAIPDLNNGEEYTFTITATTDLGTSTPSDGITATPTSPVTPLVPQCVSKVGSIVAFGNQIAGQTSDEEGLDISNTGNISSSIFLKGTDWVDGTDRSVIDIGQTRYSGTESLDFQDKIQLSNSNVLFNDNLESGVTDIVYLQLSLDLLVAGFTGTATQTITVVTSCDP